MRPDALTGILGSLNDSGYAGAFDADRFRIRLARRTSSFYATYVFGRVEQRLAGSTVLLHFGQRAHARAALWVLRIIGLLLGGAMLLAGIQQAVFLLFAVLIAVGIGSLLWLYRLRSDDVARLRSLVLASTR